MKYCPPGWHFIYRPSPSADWVSAPPLLRARRCMPDGGSAEAGDMGFFLRHDGCDGLLLFLFMAFHPEVERSGVPVVAVEAARCVEE